VAAEQRPRLIRPIILSGGSGTRLWPLSRSLFPKQLHPLVSEKSLLQETALRVSGPEFAAPIVICNEEHRFMVAEQLREVGLEAEAIVLEPEGRNTAPAVAIGALMREDAADEALLVLPSDHVIRDNGAFVMAVNAAVAAAASGYLVAFGISPTGPETGYGYIKRGAPLDGIEGCYAIDRFVEKPDADTAKKYLEDGGYDWNGGMFLFAPGTYLAELDRTQPGMVAFLREALAKAVTDFDFIRLDRDTFGKVTSISIDYAVMEQTEQAAVVPVDMGWSDVGAWDALWAIENKDAQQNVLVGDVITEDVRNTYIRGGSKLIAAAGLENIVVVATDDAVLVSSMDKAQSVKNLVDKLKSDGRAEHVSHTRVYRPWGWYQSLEVGDRYQVKLIEVSPGAKLSLQSHRHRAEHWVVVEGQATVTRGDECLTLNENESTYIPIGMKHRLENVTEKPLQIIEVQSGSYLGEDDIERFDDTYGRS